MRKRAKTSKSKFLTQEVSKQTNTSYNESKMTIRSFKSFGLSDWIIFTFGIGCLVLAGYLLFNGDSLKVVKQEKTYNVGSFGQKIEVNNKKPAKEVKNTLYEDPPETDKIFTSTELANYAASKGSTIYLAIFGEVYDVSSGAFYQEGGGYDFFTGKDGSYGFVTGKPEDAVETLPSDAKSMEIEGVLDWVMFYRNHEDYSFVGKLQGSYWTSEGESTSERERFKEIYVLHKANAEFEATKTKRYPHCRMKFLDREKKLVEYWCDKGRVELLQREGLEPKSILVPRKIHSRLKESDRCGCIELDVARLNEGYFKPFESCEEESQTCESNYL